MSSQPNPATMKIDSTPVARRERRPVIMRAVAMREDGSTFEIFLVDLSYEGCGIETPVELQPGEALKLSVLRRGGVDAHVRWCAEGRAGLVFDPVDTGDPKQVPRRSSRISLTADVSLRRLGQNNYRVRTSDLSPEGCKVELVERPRIGEHVLIKFEGLEVLDAEVCWVEEFVAGLSFEKPIHPAVFDLLLQRLT